MKAYKGFNKDMTCRGFQYEEGKEYETDRAKLCEEGFHACINPLDCFNYYKPGASVYHEVEIEDNGQRHDGDSKVVGKKIQIGAAINLRKIIKAGVDIIIQSAKKITSGDESHAATSGDGSHAATSGWRSNAATSGDGSHAATSGWRSHAATSGDGSHAATSGNGSHAATSGWRSNAATSGCGSNAVTSGCGSNAVTSGDGSHAEVKSRDSVAAACGKNCMVKACTGSVIFAVERGEWDGQAYPILAAKTAIVDGTIIKPDTWYKLENGELVEAE